MYSKILVLFYKASVNTLHVSIASVLWELEMSESPFLLSFLFQTTINSLRCIVRHFWKENWFCLVLTFARIKSFISVVFLPMLPFFAAAFKTPSLLELLHGWTGKCGPIRKAVLLLQWLLYKGSWRDLVLCQTSATGSFLYNAVCPWNKFKWLVVWGYLTELVAHIPLAMRCSNVTALIKGNNASPEGSLEENGSSGPSIHRCFSLSPCLESQVFVPTVADLILALALVHLFPESWLLCWKPVRLVNLSSGEARFAVC